MAERKPGKLWTIIIAILLLAITSGGITIWSRYSMSQPIEIFLPPPEEFQGEVCLSGAVGNPGIYPVKSSDRLEDILKRAGSISESADLAGLELYIPQVGEEKGPQKVNINRAEAWLIESLPGIGETKAKAIIEYREQNGPYHSISELLNVEGIGAATYEQIRHLITVAE